MFKLGKYKTRGGSEAVILHIGPIEQDYPLIGYYVCPVSNRLFPQSWTKEGRFSAHISKHDNNLINPTTTYYRRKWIKSVGGNTVIVGTNYHISKEIFDEIWSGNRERSDEWEVITV